MVFEIPLYMYYAAVCLYYAAICLEFAGNMLIYAFIMLLYACILLYACLYVDMMYACSLFVTHTDIFSPLPSGSVTITRARWAPPYEEVVFSQHIPPSACIGCRRVHNAHAPGWGCGRLAWLVPP